MKIQTGLGLTSNSTQLIVPDFGTVAIPIAASEDDGHEYHAAGVSGTWDVNGATDNAILGFHQWVNGPNRHVAAFSFDTDGQIPQGSQISSATLTLNVDTGFENTGIDFDFWGQAIDSASAPSQSNLPSTWAHTAEFVKRTDLPTLDALLDITVTAIVQEILDRASWDEGRINIFTESNIFSGTNNWAVSLEDDTEDAPLLTIVN